MWHGAATSESSCWCVFQTWKPSALHSLPCSAWIDWSQLSQTNRPCRSYCLLWPLVRWRFFFFFLVMVSIKDSRHRLPTEGPGHTTEQTRWPSWQKIMLTGKYLSTARNSHQLRVVHIRVQKVAYGMPWTGQRDPTVTYLVEGLERHSWKIISSSAPPTCEIYFAFYYDMRCKLAVVLVLVGWVVAAPRPPGYRASLANEEASVQRLFERSCYKAKPDEPSLVCFRQRKT